MKEARYDLIALIPADHPECLEAQYRCNSWCGLFIEGRPAPAVIDGINTIVIVYRFTTEATRSLMKARLEHRLASLSIKVDIQFDDVQVWVPPKAFVER